MSRRVLGAVVLFLTAIAMAAPGARAQAPDPDPRVAELAAEVAVKGWVVYGARSASGSWDLYLARPDGAHRRNITNTPDFEEAAPRFSPDGKRLLYRRLAKGTAIDHDQWGFQGELILADADGGSAAPFGGEGEFPWASWSPDGTQLACLTKKGIEIVTIADKAVVRKLPRQGIYQQLFWSPDGKWFCGTGNHGGESWTVVRMNAETGEVNPARSYQNCTPEWFPDSAHILLSSRPANQPGAEGYGYTQLWAVSGDGADQRLLYGEDGFHLYGGAVSPDGKYLLFTNGKRDGSSSDKNGAPLCLMRMADAPSIGGPSPDLRALHPQAKDGPVLRLSEVWEPHWTYAEVVRDGAAKTGE